jgi:integrase
VNIASIEKRTDSEGHTSYRVKVRLKGFPAQSTTFKRLTDARRWAKQTEVAIQEGRHFKTTEAKRHTLGELVDRYLRDVLPAKRLGTIQKQKPQLEWWKAQIGAYTLAHVTPALIVEQRDRLARTPIPAGKPRSPATVVRYLAALSHAFTVAVKEWGWLEDNPCCKVSRPKETRDRVRFLADDERDRLLDACKVSESADLYVAVVLSLSTGARKMEIMGLRWGQVGFSTAGYYPARHQERGTPYPSFGGARPGVAAAARQGAPY